MVKSISRLVCVAAAVLFVVVSPVFSEERATKPKAEKPRYQFRRTGKVLFVDDSRTEFERLDAGIEVYYSKQNRQWVVINHKSHETKFVGKLAILKLTKIDESTSETMEHLDRNCLATWSDKDETLWLVDSAVWGNGLTDFQVENEIEFKWKESARRSTKSVK